MTGLTTLEQTESSARVPRLSVVMPVHNALPFLDRSIESILAQSFTDFELVVRDDGSTDGSGDALLAWRSRDPRIRVFQGPQLGPAGSSNAVVRHSRAPLIARMDADDLATPDRLARQIEILQHDPKIVLVGSLCETIDAEDRLVRSVDSWRAMRRSTFAPFPHASVMMRREAFDQIGGYRPTCDYWEDLDLYLRLERLGLVAVICDPLIRYRVSPRSTRLVSAEEGVDRSIDRMYRCVSLYGRDRAYDSLLIEGRAGTPAKLGPETYVARGSTQLWAGQRPAVLKRLVRSGQLRLDRATAIALTWAMWSELHPASLRWFLRLLHQVRNLSVKGMIEPGQIVGWSPRAARERA